MARKEEICKEKFTGIPISYLASTETAPNLKKKKPDPKGGKKRRRVDFLRICLE